MWTIDIFKRYIAYDIEKTLAYLFLAVRYDMGFQLPFSIMYVL